MTIVDDIDYSLNLDSAANELVAGRDVECKEFPDYGADDLFDCYGAPNHVLTAESVRDLSRDQIIDALRCYEAFAPAARN